MARTDTQTAARPRRRQAGSAYVIALLALVVLTILGLALALVTQSEMQVGANERLINRVFYAADSGIAVAVAHALVKNDYDERTFAVPDSASGALVQLRNEVELSQFYPLLDAPCNLCEINERGSYGASAYRKINHGVTSTASRRSLDPAAEAVAMKRVSAMVEVQPWKPSLQSYKALEDPAKGAQILF
jgi:Tfp pilus assembly protein PilX